jgi:AcrR family transcriptional regulator
VAGDLFAAHGFHGLSMEEIADAAGVSKPVLYRHFPSKRKLYLALIRTAVEHMQAEVRSALAGTTDNQQRVEGAILAYFEFIEDRRFRLLFGNTELTDAEVRAAVQDASAEISAEVGELIAEDAGLDRQSADFLASALRGLAMDGARWWVDHPGVDKHDAVKLLARVVWRGLAAFPATQSPLASVGQATPDHPRPGHGTTGHDTVGESGA